MSSDKVFTIEDVDNLLKHRDSKFRASFIFSEGDVFTAFIPYHHSENLYKLRPCVVIRSPKSRDIEIIIISSTSKPESGKKYYHIQDIDETHLHTSDSELLLEKYPIPRNHFWKKIGKLSDRDKEQLLEETMYL